MKSVPQARAQLADILQVEGQIRRLGRVGIQREFMTAAAILIMAAKL
jgi:hypothetical protein